MQIDTCLLACLLTWKDKDRKKQHNNDKTSLTLTFQLQLNVSEKGKKSAKTSVAKKLGVFPFFMCSEFVSFGIFRV